MTRNRDEEGTVPATPGGGQVGIEIDDDYAHYPDEDAYGYDVAGEEEEYERRPRGDGLPAEDSAARVLMRWVFGLASVVALAALFGAYTFQQLSAEGPAKRIIARAVLPITEVDRLLTGDYMERLREEGTLAAEEGEEVTLPGLPMTLTFPPDEVMDLSADELRLLIVTTASDRVYEEGLDAFRLVERDGAQEERERLSPQWTLDVTLGNLNRDAHGRVEVWIQTLGIASALALTLFLMLGRGMGRVVLLGVVVTLAAAASLVATFGVRAALTAFNSAGGDPFVGALDAVAETASTIPVRNYVTLSVAGLAVIAIGVVSSLVARQFQYREDW